MTVLLHSRPWLWIGKTTFLNDTTKSHKCTYIRQYHNIRPYVTVSAIPNFDPKQLPYWDIYEREGKADTIQVGGTMAGQLLVRYNRHALFSVLRRVANSVCSSICSSFGLIIIF